MVERTFSAPGRVEIGGNHTDHQNGRVLTAAVNLETACTAAANGSTIARIVDARFGVVEIDLSRLAIRDAERGTSAALLRGVAAWFQQNGYAIGGFDAHLSSNIPIGAGLSSSAAFEVVIGNVLKNFFNCGANLSSLDIARAGQYAENVYFGKPCGLMDQTASSFGGLTLIDFRDSRQPTVTPVKASFEGYQICVVSTGGSHADLTPDYAAIPAEMKAVAAHFDRETLREVNPEEFYALLPKLRHLSDRSLLRALHYFDENERVLQQAAALEAGDMPAFLSLANESGRSSLAYLQNVYSPSTPLQQGVTLALALSEQLLAGVGAWRVHGGGFAGTILAFVPDELRDTYRSRMCEAFGADCCHFLKIQNEGGREVNYDD